MENASKALIMAGGILISIMVASFLIFVLRKGGSMSAEYDSQRADQQLADFNRQFEVYDKNGNTFLDIITVANLAYDVNKRNGYDLQNKMEIKIQQENNANTLYSILSNAGLPKNHFCQGENFDANKLQEINSELINEYTEQTADSSDSEKQIYIYTFDCIARDYNTTTGKIQSMTFKIRKHTP